MHSYWVYILYSEKTDTFYRGQTHDIIDRIRESIKEIPAKPAIDIVFVSVIDTVFIEKRIDIPVYLTRSETSPKETIESEISTLAGKSLAEQEEIRNLLA